MKIWGEDPMALCEHSILGSLSMNSASFIPPSTHDESRTKAALPADTVPFSALTPRLAAAVLKYLGGRGLLLGIESREALRQAITVLAWLVLSAIAAFAAWILLATSLVMALTELLEWSWMNATLGVGAANVLIAFIAALVASSRLSASHWFSDSINELKKDRAWLKTQATRN